MTRSASPLLSSCEEHSSVENFLCAGFVLRSQLLVHCSFWILPALIFSCWDTWKTLLNPLTGLQDIHNKIKYVISVFMYDLLQETWLVTDGWLDVVQATECTDMENS
jgi:hypothetical protein